MSTSINTRIKESLSAVCSDVATKDIEASLKSLQDTEIYNHINSLTDKDIKEAMKYAYSNQTVNSTVNDTLTEQSITSVVETINKMSNQNTVNFVMTNSSDISNMNIVLENKGVQTIVAEYKTWTTTLAKNAIDKVTDRLSGNSSDISNGTTADTDNSAGSFADASSKNDQSGDQDAETKQSYSLLRIAQENHRRQTKPIITQRAVGEPYFPRRGLLVAVAEEAMRRREACGLFSGLGITSDVDVTKESLNADNQQTTNIDQAITQEVYEDYDLSQTFDIALSSITESVNKTKTSNISSTSIEAMNQMDNTNTVNINIDGVSNVDGIDIRLTNEGAQNIQSFNLVANVLSSQLTAVEKGVVLDLLGLVAHQDLDSSTSAESTASSTSSMESTQEISQKAVTKQTNTVAIIVLIVIIIAIILIACFASRDKDPVFDPHGGKAGKAEKSDYTYESSDSTPKKVEVPVEVDYVPTIETNEVKTDS